MITKRKEADKFEVLSGIFENKTTGTPITAIIRNTNQHSADYESLKYVPRPSHADLTGSIRYNGYNDLRGGGHFSGRLTAPIVFAGALSKLALKKFNINIIAHILSAGNVSDIPFDSSNITQETIEQLSNKEFPVLTTEAQNKMMTLFQEVRRDMDSVGGIIECAITGLDAGIGSPMFGGVESRLSSIIFGIPAVKGIEFGAGFNFAPLRGSEANDEYYIENGKIKTYTNNNGGILGGITNGMPILFRVAIKPTPSIGKVQNTVDIKTMKNTKLEIKGRHDPCILPRAVPVVEAAAAIAILELLLEQRGYYGFSRY